MVFFLSFSLRRSLFLAAEACGGVPELCGMPLSITIRMILLSSIVTMIRDSIGSEAVMTKASETIQNSVKS